MSEVMAAQQTNSSAKKTVKAAILVDIGNSETRCYFVYDGKEYFHTYLNKYATLTEGYKIPEDYINERSTVFKVNNEVIANGELATREFPKIAKKPNSQQFKTNQITTVDTLTFLFIQAYMEISKYSGIPIENLDIVFDVVAALPPSEHKSKSDDLKNMVRGITEVEVLTPVAFVKPITVDRVYVVSEGAAAFTAAMYEEDDGDIVESETNADYLKGYVLVLDIGAGTTDIILFKDADVVIESKESIPIGGNMVIATCKKLINEEFNYKPDDDVMQKVLETGMLTKGNREFDVTKYLNEAKQNFGAQIYNNLLEYVDSHPIELRDIKGLLVAGGGALPAMRDGKVVSVSMAEVLVRFITELTSTISLVDIHKYSPRHLNIDGLRLFYLYKND